MGKRLDLTGQRFGRLVVISLNEEVSKQKKRSYWNCICDCGNEKVIKGSNLRGGTQSCGCLNKEIVREQMREMVKEKWQDEEFRQMQSNKARKQMREQWQDEEFRQMHSELGSKILKQKWQDEEFKQMRSESSSKTMKKIWQDEEFRQMRSDKMKNESNPNYKGGIIPISKHLRCLNEEWFDNCKKEANYTCQLTGKLGWQLHTHHLYAFSSIVMDAHNTYNIEVKPQVKDYTQEELKLLEDYVAEWHKDSSNAVVLSEEAHKLFHSLYGKRNNTPEQYEEFKQRYINGEFKDLI